MNKNVFGNKLKELREIRGIKQRELSKELGFSRTTLSGWERGARNPSLDDVVLIAKYFNVSTDFLLGLEDL